MAGRGLPASLPGDMGVRGLLSPSVCCAFRFRNFVDMRLRSEPRRRTRGFPAFYLDRADRVDLLLNK